jgi:alkylation response protein AidB-like acyl-CoA dehydrogenase
MNFDWPGEDDPRRLDVRAWFATHPKPTYRDLFEAGYTVPHWPRPWGLDADPELQLIIDEEIERAGMVLPALAYTNAVAICAKLLLSHGTQWQRDRYLARALSGEDFWTQLLSEPSGGSDLAALRTTATPDGDDYVVNGSKIWNGGTHFAQVSILLARTDSTVVKHAGLSLFLLDMDLPGITVRPIVDMSGQHEFNQTFLDNVRVPARCRIGREGEGWALVNLMLQSERAFLGRPGIVFSMGHTARELMKGLEEIGALDDPVIHDRAAALYVEGEVLRILSLHTLSEQINRRPPGPGGALHKMLAAPHGQRFVQLSKEAHGMAGLVEGEQPFPSQTPTVGARANWHRRYEDWDHAFWYSPGSTLGGGSQQIVKNVVAERVLGLPREVDETARKPFNEILRGSPR